MKRAVVYVKHQKLVEQTTALVVLMDGDHADLNAQLIKMKQKLDAEILEKVVDKPFKPNMTKDGSAPMLYEMGKDWDV